MGAMGLKTIATTENNKTAAVFSQRKERHTIYNAIRQESQRRIIK
jgi:hypothetical protein